MNLTNETYLHDISLLGKKTKAIAGVSILLYILIGVLAVLGNSCIIAVFLKYRDLRDSTSTFIINLGVTDLVTGSTIFVVLALEPTGQRQGTFIGCLGSSLIIQYLSLVSHSLILVTTFERFIGICRRNNYQNIFTTRTKFWLFLSSWSLPITVTFWPLVGFNNWEEKGCNFPQVYPRWTLILRTSFHFLQSAISMVLYFKILVKARELQTQVRPGPIQGINRSTTRYNTISRSIKNSRVVALLTILFFASWLPYNVSIVIYCLSGIWPNQALASSFKLFGVANSMMNPFLYAWQRKCIRKKLDTMVKCRKENTRAYETPIRLRSTVSRQTDRTYRT